MSIPSEFTPSAITRASKDARQHTYHEFHTSGEPYRSLIDNNPWLRPPSANKALEWGKGWYYDTTIARLHPEWQNTNLPQPTKALQQLESDFIEWGYCLIEDGVSSHQCIQLRERIEAQAEAERQLKIAHVSPAQQHVWALVNKGQIFVECMQHNPDAVQSGPLIEHLLDGFAGSGWNHLSFIANISFSGCHPQGMHQDQSLIAPYITEVPVLVNTIYILQDIDHTNGGTLIIPGSHRANSESQIKTNTNANIKAKGQFGPLPRPINLEAPAGTIMLMDGRLLHGGAVNRSETLRYIITNSVVRPWVRQQECFHLTIRPEVLANASDKFLMRCGFQATGARSMVEGYGYAGSGAIGDPNGALKHARLAMDAGEYEWVGELNPEDLTDLNPERYTLARTQRHETHRGQHFENLLTQMQASNTH